MGRSDGAEDMSALRIVQVRHPREQGCRLQEMRGIMEEDRDRRALSGLRMDR